MPSIERLPRDISAKRKPQKYLAVWNFHAQIVDHELVATIPTTDSM